MVSGCCASKASTGVMNWKIDAQYGHVSNGCAATCAELPPNNGTVSQKVDAQGFDAMSMGELDLTVSPDGEAKNAVEETALSRAQEVD